MRDRKYYSVYIMGSLSGTLYIGVSSNLHRRVFQHKFHHFEGFTSRYEVVRPSTSNRMTMFTKPWLARGS